MNELELSIYDTLLNDVKLRRENSYKLSKRFKVSIDVIKKIRKALKHRFDKPKAPRILIFDIETSPLKAYVWRRWQQNIYLDQTISEWFMICWSAKWLDGKEVLSDVLTPEEILKENDFRIVKSLRKLLDEADIVVAHNGDKFDVPKINTRIIVNNLKPVSPYKQIDTKKIACKQFGFSSNKLDALATMFGFQTKLDTDFELWKSCLEGDSKALKYMEKYNRYDVVLLEKVFKKLLPYAKNIPNIAVYMDSEEMICTHCGSNHLKESGYYYTQTGKYKTFVCNDCGAYSRERYTSYKNKKTLLTNTN